jgi:hypothetical protein
VERTPVGPRYARPWSEPFAAFDRVQRELNGFLWSSELAFELVRQRLLDEELRNDSRWVHEVFADVKCHAFVPPGRVRSDPGLDGRPPVKYRVRVPRFERHLDRDLEPVSRFVIIAFHGALERFAKARLRPFFSSPPAGWDPGEPYDPDRAVERFIKESYPRWGQVLVDQRGIVLSPALGQDTTVKAQVHRMVRNKLTHQELEWPWSDAGIRRAAGHLAADQRKHAVEGVCDRASMLAANRPDVTILFFYAVFCFTDYRNFAAALDAALPRRPRHP